MFYYSILKKKHVISKINKELYMEAKGNPLLNNFKAKKKKNLDKTLNRLT